MRFSLATLFLIVLWLAALVTVVLTHSPWIKISQRKITTLEPMPEWVLSPDGQYYAGLGSPGVFVVPIKGQETSYLNDKHIWRPIRFLSNDELLLQSGGMNPEMLESIWRRRFSQEWWGHFCRPELWLFVATTAALFLKLRDRVWQKPAGNG